MGVGVGDTEPASVMLSEKFPRKEFLSTLKDEKKPARAQGTPSAKAAGEKNFLVCSRNRLGSGGQGAWGGMWSRRLGGPCRPRGSLCGE